jgi:hypothetical protein
MTQISADFFGVVSVSMAHAFTQAFMKSCREVLAYLLAVMARIVSVGRLVTSSVTAADVSF